MGRNSLAQLHLGPGEPPEELSPAGEFLVIPCPLGSSWLLLHRQQDTRTALVPSSKYFQRVSCHRTERNGLHRKAGSWCGQPRSSRERFPSQLAQVRSSYGGARLSFLECCWQP